MCARLRLLFCALLALEWSFVHARPDSRVMGGGPAAPGMYPYQAGVMWGGQLICGCVIINANSALTAAHCMYNNPVQGFYVLAGSQDLRNGTSYTVIDYILHPEFISSNGFPNDLAILKVDPPFVLDGFLQTAPLVANGTEFASGTPATALGWGMTYTGSEFPDVLQSVDLQVYSDRECLQTWIFGPASTNLCAGQPPGEIGAGTCGGDSGSALVVNGEVAGISSFEHVPCGTRPQPAVYTQVSLYIDWITDTAGL